jgi:SagB-type dehydrogenase family enzyme
MIPLDDPTTLSLLFHLNSEPWLNDEAYQAGSAQQEFETPERILSEVALPAPEPTALGELLRLRRSCRAFALRPLPLAALASVLHAAYGEVDAGVTAGAEGLLRRTVPSAGGLFPLEIHVVLRSVDGIEDGVYHYDVPAHALQQTARGDAFAALEPSFYAFPFIRDANAVVLVAAVFRRTQKKYGPRGYRYILLEAGHVVQNVCLAAAGRDLATLCMGGFVDSRVNGLLGLDPRAGGVVYSVALGRASLEDAGAPA